MTMTTIPLSRCKNRMLYEIRSRNLDFGVFCQKTSGFIGIRTKFDNQYLFEEYHHDTGPPFGTVVPVKEMIMLPDNIVLNIDADNMELFDWIDDTTHNMDYAAC